MFGIRPATRFAFVIAFFVGTILWLASDYGIIPNPVKNRIEGRTNLSKAVAMNMAVAVESNRLFEFSKFVERVVEENDDIKSIAVRRINGTFPVLAGENHQECWDPESDETASHVSIDVALRERPWGQLQILYHPSVGAVESNVWYFPFSMITFVSGSVCLLSWLLLSRVMNVSSGKTVMPQRVRSALDTLTEGLALIDAEGEIVHANQAFAEIIDAEPDDVLGSELNSYGFEQTDSVTADGIDFDDPWDECIVNKESVRGAIRKFASKSGPPRKFIVNASPIFAEKGAVRGVLVSFDDVTALENKKTELAKMLHTLRQSRDEISRQNIELQFLANCDPLTKCYNRRSFWNRTQEVWGTVAPEQLSIIMIDIDHFKSVNDTYGHSVGDAVLCDIGELLRNLVGDRGFVCRYGGEEFCVLVSSSAFTSAIKIANEIHSEIRKQELGGINVTASIGVSNASLGAMDMQHMLDQADQCLYAAKHKGRDQVVRFDECDFSLEAADGEDSENPKNKIDYSTVTSLLSALAFRSPKTAEHSIRVADLAVAIGSSLVSKTRLYRFEIAALLHDIGKIGVPDAVLNKPGALTDEEATLMKSSREIGLRIVSSALECDEVVEIMRFQHVSYSEYRAQSSSVLQDGCPLESRIISACDAFDSMINDQVYRKGMTLTAAIQELKRCTPDQFDPVVVDALITYVSHPEYLKTRDFQLQSSDSNSTTAIGQHIQMLQSAIVDNNVQQMQAAVEELTKDAGNATVAPVYAESTHQNSKLISAQASAKPEPGDDGYEEVIGLAEEVLELCRSTRKAIVNLSPSETDGTPIDGSMAVK